MNYTGKTMQSFCIKSLSFLLILSVFVGCKSGQEKEGSGGRISDVEGNSYMTVQIGDQLWMAENLKTNTFSDGTPIQKVEEYEEWANLTLPAYCWYNNDSLTSDDFGALYNCYAIETEKLCPEGWHVPSDEDWIKLETALGGAGSAGGAMKEPGTAYWKTPNTQASNESGFTARPGGYRSYNGTFNLMRIDGFWWSTSEKSWYGSSNTVIYRNLKYDGQDLFRDVAVRANGFSVRCVKNP
ncbi:MAG: hypothetical protein DRJ29_05935 [Bacteroidetes bacterium]|nr:MAG: hypothetical protein DRI98_03545 [Bacteroidota bacterium]RLD94413.1 MAG: hypothetical protein DRJ29_05935 [Bacteroidota bacterium]